MKRAGNLVISRVYRPTLVLNYRLFFQSHTPDGAHGVIANLLLSVATTQNLLKLIGAAKSFSLARPGPARPTI